MDDKDSQPPSNILRAMRGARKMQVQELAQKTGLDANTIYLIEHFYTRPKPDTIGILAEALGCSYVELAALEQQPILKRRKVYGKNNEPPKPKAA